MFYVTQWIVNSLMARTVYGFLLQSQPRLTRGALMEKRLVLYLNLLRWKNLWARGPETPHLPSHDPNLHLWEMGPVTSFLYREWASGYLDPMAVQSEKDLESTQTWCVVSNYLLLPGLPDPLKSNFLDGNQNVNRSPSTTGSLGLGHTPRCGRVGGY